MIPIKQGTAQRLGLKQPEPRPLGFFRLGSRISDMDAEALAEAFRKAAMGKPRLMVLPEESSEQWQDSRQTNVERLPGRWWWKWWLKA